MKLPVASCQLPGPCRLGETARATGNWQLATLILLLTLLLPCAPLLADVLDDFDDVSDWIAAPSDGVELRISSERGAMRLDFDFHGGAGYAIARKPVKLQLPSDYEFTFSLRGETPPNTL